MRKTYCKSGLLIAMTCLFLAAGVFISSAGSAHASEQYTHVSAQQSYFAAVASRHRHHSAARLHTRHHYLGYAVSTFDDCNCGPDQGTSSNSCNYGCAPSPTPSSCDVCGSSNYTQPTAPNNSPSCNVCGGPNNVQPTTPNDTAPCDTTCTTVQQDVTGKVTTIDVETTTTTTTTINHHSSSCSSPPSDCSGTSGGSTSGGSTSGGTTSSNNTCSYASCNPGANQCNCSNGIRQNYNRNAYRW